MIFNTNDNSSTIASVLVKNASLSGLQYMIPVEFDVLPKEIDVDGSGRILCPRILNVMARVAISSKGSKAWVPVTNYYFSRFSETVVYFYVGFPEEYAEYNYNESRGEYTFDIQVIYEIGA